MIKSQLRKSYLESRSLLSPDEKIEASRQIACHFFDRFKLDSVKTLHCFISIPKFSEIDTSLIYKHVWSEFPKIVTVAPRVDREQDKIDSLVFTKETELVENEWGIREPTGDQIVDAAMVDIVLVPLLCFDKRGYRVGYGKGYYDKFLVTCRPDCLKIGLSFFPPADMIVDINDHDVRLDLCVTSDGTMGFEK